MKRSFAIAAAIVLSLALSGCGNKNESNQSNTVKGNCDKAIYDAKRLIKSSEYLETAPVGEFSSEEQQKFNSKRQYKEAMEIILEFGKQGCFTEDQVNKAGDYLIEEVKSGGS